MKEFDVVIVGGGMVGATVGCGLGNTNLKVAIIEQAVPDDFSIDQPHDLRVSALSLASKNILKSVGAWEGVLNRRYCPFKRMRVWETAGDTEFNSDDIDLPELGYIVENRVTQLALLDKLADFDGVSFKGQLLDSKRKGRQWLGLEMGYARGVVTERYKYIALRYPKAVQEKITDENRKEYNWQGNAWINYKEDFPKDAIGHLPVYVKFPGYYDYDQLYDLEKDPMETVNLAGDSAYKGVLEDMKKKLREHIKSTGQVFGKI